MVLHHCSNEQIAIRCRAFQGPDHNVCLAHRAFAPPQPGSNAAGSWTGVCVCVCQMSDCPLRPLCVPWRGFGFESGSVMVSFLCFRQQMLTGAVGPPRCLRNRAPFLRKSWSLVKVDLDLSLEISMRHYGLGCFQMLLHRMDLSTRACSGQVSSPSYAYLQGQHWRPEFPFLGLSITPSCRLGHPSLTGLCGNMPGISMGCFLDFCTCEFRWPNLLHPYLVSCFGGASRTGV